jgi:hypothetical protein
VGVRRRMAACSRPSPFLPVRPTRNSRFTSSKRTTAAHDAHLGSGGQTGHRPQRVERRRERRLEASCSPRRSIAGRRACPQARMSRGASPSSVSSPPNRFSHHTDGRGTLSVSARRDRTAASRCRRSTMNLDRGHTKMQLP